MNKIDTFKSKTNVILNETNRKFPTFMLTNKEITPCMQNKMQLIITMKI